MNYIKARLAEHSTQVALSADFAALLSALSGQITWAAFAAILVGSLSAILFPSH